MVNALQICRICLSVNMKMFTLKNSNMENLYNLLTQVYVDMEDGKPTTVCFICYARLQQCDRLQQQAIKSIVLLEQLLTGGLMQATANTILDNQYNSQDLQISSIYQLDLEPTNCKDVISDPIVEANDLILIKEEEEAIDEGHNVTDFSENANYSINFECEVVKSDPEDDQPSIAIVSNKSVGIQDVVHEKEGRKRQEIENLCIVQNETGVRNYPRPSSSIKITKKGAEENNMESRKNLDKKKGASITNKQNFQKPLNNNENAEVDKKSKRKWNETIVNVVPNKQKNQKSIHDKHTKEENINTSKTSIINTITDEFQCNECGKQFSTKDVLTDHILKCMKTTKADMLKSLTSKMFSCDSCTFKTYNEHFLEVHFKKHSATKMLSCNICDYMCAKKSHLKQHIRTHTGEKPYSCDICVYRCSNKKHLILHMRSHTGEKPYSCDICAYRFSNKHNMKVHMRSHTGEKPYSCDICVYRCSHKHSLKVHMRSHTGEKPYSCDICVYRCSNKQNLKVHMRSHTGEKPYSCDICVYRCSYKQYLKVHMRSHTGEKPYSCDICVYRCSQKAHLKYHMTTHTTEKPLFCNKCEYKCARKSDLKRHMNTHR